METASSSWRWKGKSLWLGNGGEEVNVETRALQYYEGLGYRGFVRLLSAFSGHRLTALLDSILKPVS